MRSAWTLGLLLLAPWTALAADWPQWLGPKRDGVWREAGLVDKFPPGGPKTLWRAPLGQGYSGPAVVGDRVYVMDRIRPKGPDGKPARPTRDGVPGQERVLCLDAKTGKEVWKHEYNCPYRMSYGSGPRVTPLVRDGKVWTLGGMGDLYCLNEKDGKPIWHKNLMKEYGLADAPVWGYAAHPLIDGELLYTLVGGPGSAVVALNKDTGKEVWKALDTDEVGYSPPMVVEAGGKKQLLIWLSESVNGLDPLTGKVYWTQEYPVGRPPMRPAVNIMTLVPHGRRVFLSTFYHGPMMLELDANKPGARVVWRGKSNNVEKPDGAHVMMAAPVFKDGCVFANCAMGELRCLDAETGKQKWQTYDLTGGEKADCASAFFIPQGDRVVVCNDQGELILARLSAKGHEVISKAKVIEPVEEARGRKVVWSHPAFANKCVYLRNDKEMVCVSLAAS
ncbi:MAG: PQQ-binding-like beta-propeller repeat protein [Gemmataceae bacterium]